MTDDVIRWHLSGRDPEGQPFVAGAVELDGVQHLADRVAYRRDRRKDPLLQESGYLVLRFLAEDLGRDLDTVLDTILRALSHRASSGSAAPLHFIRGGRA